MKLTSIQAGYFKLDGGAMFGIVPKQLWSRKIKADSNNMCSWCMRCLLIETGDRKILVDTGMGDKQDEKFRSHFEPHGPYSLLGSLQEQGVKAEDITDVFITHLHFDHVGGAVSRNNSGKLVPTFPNAKYWMHQKHYDWAIEPNLREKASFLKENFVPLAKEGVAEFLDFKDRMQWHDGIEIRLSHGHTSHMMHLLIPYKGTKLVYCADLMPSKHHIGLPYIMSYDIQPLVTLEEKTEFLGEALEKQYLLFYEHDLDTEIGLLNRNDRGRIIQGQSLTLADL